MSRLRSDDTIAAIATPAGAGGIGIVRLSGGRALELLSALSGRPSTTFADRVLTRGIAVDAVGSRLDDVLFVAMRGPRSFTGEDVVEIHGHGGVANMGRLLRACLQAGARLAEPGEFTRRAFENGNLDLPTAEALLAVIEAGSERGLRVAQSQLGGRLGRALRTLRDLGTELLATVEASIDFPDEGLEKAESETVRASLGKMLEELEALISSFELGRALRSGIVVALTGPVNAGKSSLLNALADRERALVSAEPGTTRDYVEVDLVWAGVPVTLIDTAGERPTGEGLEARGIELGRRRAAQADVEVILVPPGEPVPPAAARQLLVASKCDLDAVASAELATSAETGEGLDELKRAVLEYAIPASRDADDGLVVTSERQRDQLVEARSALSRAVDLLGSAPELIAVDLRTANDALARGLGEEIEDEVLDELFARFCIGK